MELTEAEEKAKAFDAVVENGWFVGGGEEYNGYYVSLDAELNLNVIGRGETPLAAIQDAMSKEGGK